MLRLYSYPFDNLFDHRDLIPYWRNIDHNSYNFSESIGEIINDESKFGLQIDVSHFNPENLKVNLNGRELNVEGEEEVRSSNGYSRKKFSRMVLLPEDVDLQSLSTSISNQGKMTIEAAKKTLQSNNIRNIPITFKNN